MAELNTQALKDFMAAQQWEQAGKLLENYFREQFTNQEDSEVLLKVTAAYLETMNKLNKEHLEVLNETLSALRNINKEQKAEEDQIDLELARSQISDS